MQNIPLKSVTEYARKTLFEAVKQGSAPISKQYRHIDDEEKRDHIIRNEAETLVADFLRIDIDELRLNTALNRAVEVSSRDKLDIALQKRINGVPLQYITHTANFCGLDLYVDERVLIPRPETELSVDLVLRELNNLYGGGNDLDVDSTPVANKVASDSTRGDKDSIPARKDDMQYESRRANDKNRKIKVYDLCSGSGCISAALACNFANLDIYAVEKSEPANEVQSKNINDSRELFKEGSDVHTVCENIFTRIYKEKCDIVVSNPPYVDKIDKDSSITEEPELALLGGGEDGSVFPVFTVALASQILKKHGFFVIEIGYNQGEIVKNAFTKFDFTDIIVHKDLSGQDRVVTGRLK